MTMNKGRANPADRAASLSRKALADQMITGAVRVMVADGIPMPLIIDRLMSFAAAQSSACNGDTQTAQAFRQMADRVDAGALKGNLQ